MAMNSTALVILNQADKIEKTFFAGDPATTFHELRRFLFMHGVDTKLYSAARISSGFSSRSTSIAMDMFCMDNAFFSEYRAMVAVETTQKRIVLNTLIFILRVFFTEENNGSGGSMQIMLNHLHDGIHELNDMYNTLGEFLVENRWEQQPREANNRLSLTNNMVFHHPFNGVHDFTSMYWKLEPILLKLGIVGSNLPIEAPF